MLAQLRADHLGPNRGYYLDVPFAETLARHATKPIVNDAGEEALRDWYRERDVLPGGIETVIGADSQIVSRSQLRACCHHRATTECASAKHPLRLRSGPHRPPRRPGRNADAGCVPGDRQGPALLPPGRGDLRGEHLAAGQPPRLTRGHRGPGWLDPAPAPPQCPDARRRGWHLHPMLLARSRRLRASLERYACPGVDAVARHVTERDPTAAGEPEHIRASRSSRCPFGTYLGHTTRPVSIRRLLRLTACTV